MADEQIEEQAKMQGTVDPYCMSCGMPMKSPEEHGTNADGTKCEDHCVHCMVDGEKK